MAEINLGKVKIPASDYAAQGNAILGIRESGKTYTATYLAEQLLEAGIPFIAFDPIGVWKYLRVAGKGQGYPVVVAGGRNGDLALSPESAPEIVRAAMRENIPLVIDLYDINLSKADWRSIVEQSIRLLLYENGDYGLRHVFLEEASEFVPQIVGPDQGKVYAEIEKLARMGGNALVGYTLINQRAEQINKAVLELCDGMFLHRQRGKNSIQALHKWLDVMSASETKAIIQSLPKLPTGQCWLWNQDLDEPTLLKIPEKQTAHPDRRATMTGGRGIKFDALDVTTFVERLANALEKSKVEPRGKRAAKQQVADIQSSVAALEQRAKELQDALDHSYSEAQLQEQVQARTTEIIAEKDAEIKRLKAKIVVAIDALAHDEQLVGADDGATMEDVLSAALSKMPIAPGLVSYAPMSRVKKVEQMVENNPRVNNTGKKLFRALVEEYPDFPQGLTMAKLANFCNMKMNTMVGGGGRRALMDLRDRRYITINGNGESAIVAINGEMLK